MLKLENVSSIPGYGFSIPGFLVSNVGGFIIESPFRTQKKATETENETAERARQQEEQQRQELEI
jgi:hypothetical protein